MEDNTKALGHILTQRLNDAMVEMRRDLNRQLYASASDAVTPAPLSRYRRAYRAVRSYLLNWRAALGAVGRAAIGRDAIPECDWEHY